MFEITLADIILALIIAGFIGWIAWEFYRAPVEAFDRSDYLEDYEAAERCIEASGRMPLEHPHARAITEPRK